MWTFAYNSFTFSSPGCRQCLQASWASVLQLLPATSGSQQAGWQAQKPTQCQAVSGMCRGSVQRRLYSQLNLFISSWHLKQTTTLLKHYGCNTTTMQHLCIIDCICSRAELSVWQLALESKHWL